MRICISRIISVLVICLTILVCVLPMAELPIWNGESPAHRNQYELMAENILEGRVSFSYGDEAELLQLENPYDPVERKEAGVKYHWDHAFYNGNYYMYFGIVPVFLVFLPFRILTGNVLTTFHATQIFVAIAILGIFAIFNLLAKLFFEKLPHGLYLVLAVAFSTMSVWYSVAEPALYCTAITSAIALEIWSIYFYTRAVFYEKEENRQIILAGFGALTGALVFGCRPPIAFANMLVLPLLTTFLKQRKFTMKLLGKLSVAALPYAVVAVLLMWYNVARFDNPFEFGQAYQLTLADQSQYSVTLDWETLRRVCSETSKNFFARGTVNNVFPYISATSVFFNFPILLLIFVALRPKILKEMKQSGVLSVVCFTVLTVVIIVALDIVWTPFLLERYRMDIYFLLGLACYIVIGVWYASCDERFRPYMNVGITILSLVTVTSSFLLYVKTIGMNYPEKVIEIAEYLHL